MIIIELTTIVFLMYQATVTEVFGISHMYQDRTKTSGNKGQKKRLHGRNLTFITVGRA